MSCTPKYPDEPSFTLVGRDQAAVHAIACWLARAKNLDVNETKLDDATVVLGKFQQWAADNPDKIKIPD